MPLVSALGRHKTSQALDSKPEACALSETAAKSLDSLQRLNKGCLEGKGLSSDLMASIACWNPSAP